MGFTIILPVHNEEQMLKRTLPSMIRLKPDEVVVLLDRCTDKSHEICERLMPGARLDGVKDLPPEDLRERLKAILEEYYRRKEEEIGYDNMRFLERMVMLRAMDRRWVEHLTHLENMRRSAGLYAYANLNPLIVYRKEAHDAFERLLYSVKKDVVYTIMRMEKKKEAPRKVGRNDPCPCGSGKKYKKCCGRNL